MALVKLCGHKIKQKVVNMKETFVEEKGTAGVGGR